MSIKKLVSLSTLWKGLEYYNSGRVIEFKDNGDGTFDSVVKGIELYNIHLDTNDYTKCTCTCPHGKSKKLCKHVVATFFKAFPGEARLANEDLHSYHDDELDDYDKEYEKVRNTYKTYVDSLTEEEVREFLLSQLINDYFDARTKW